MSWHFLQGQEEESWEGDCLDGAPSALLNMIPTSGTCCFNGNGMECLSDSRYGMMCEHSTASRGVATSMLSAVDSPAPTSAEQMQTQLALMAKKAAYGEKWQELSVRFDLSSASWKTHQCLWEEDLQESSVTLPRWGMMRGGVCLERITSVPRPKENEYGLWPTPCAQGSQTGGPVGLGGGSAARAKLLEICETEEEAKSLGCGKLNPQFAEWLLGWPPDWTSVDPQDCGESAMDKYRQWLEWHGAS